MQLRDPAAFAFAANGTIDVRSVGQEGEPVVIVDGASGHPAALVDFAATRSRFAAAADVGSAYPGLLGPAPTAYVDAMVRFALPLITTHFGTGPVRPARARGNFSLVTTAAAALTPDQRVPHVDAADRLQFAIVHYLCGEEAGGTGFFRHRATAFETIDAARLPVYRAALDAELATLDTAGYANDAHPLFALTDAVAPRFDRLILYRAALLHSGLVAAPPPGAADPRRGRLTGNLFLQCRTIT